MQGLASMQEFEGESDDSAFSVVQAGHLRFRWALLLFVLAALASLVDAGAVDLLNPDMPRAFWDEAARKIEDWSTRSMLLFITTGTALTCIVRRWRPRRQLFLTGFLGWFMAETIVSVLKRLIGRPRPVHPDSGLDFLRPLYERPDLKSMPSGHASAAVFFAVFVTFGTRSILLRCAAWGLAAIVMADRLYMGAHYLSDVFMGAGIGYASFLFCQRLVAMSHIPLRRGDGVVRFAPGILLVWVLITSWVFAEAPVLRDALTGHELEDFRLPSRAPSSLPLEPFLGPALKLASMPDLKSFLVCALIWAALIAAALIYFLRRRSVAILLGLGTLVLVWGTCALSGLPGYVSGPRPPAGSDRLVVDLQNHIGDPLDGGMSIEAGRQRFKRLGFDLVVPTHHNLWSQGLDLRSKEPATIELFGAEWSRGRPGDSPLHLLVFNRRPEPRDIAEIEDWRELIRRVNEAGGVVVVSHFWRGDASVMPSAAELVEAGVRGFEVAGRNQELRDDPRLRLEEIRSLCRRKRLVATASSDFHGKRSGNYTWNLISGTETDPAERVWRALVADPEEILPVVREGHPERDHGLWLPPVMFASYFRELSLPERAVWLGFAFLLSVLQQLAALISGARKRAAGG